MSRRWALALAAGLAAGCGNPGIMSPAPDFEARTLTGQALRLSSLRGKVVLLDFWATWCEPCEETIPRLEALDAEYRGKGLAVVGLSVDDDDAEVQPYVREHGMRYPVVVDADKRVMALYGVRGIPVTVLVDRAGLVRRRWLGSGDGIGDEVEAAVKKLVLEAKL